jgi:hypothetical protein
MGVSAGSIPARLTKPSSALSDGAKYLKNGEALL